ncbi:MAG: glycosyltransferase family 2 protein [Chthoniobacterales bacterium]
MKITVVIPCYNECGTLPQVVRSVRAAPVADLELIVVDDVSTDSSAEWLRGPLAAEIDRVILHERNRGKGAALRSGFAEARGEVIIIQDADLEYRPEEYPKLLARIEKGLADAVFGSRFRGGEPHRAAYFWHMIGNKSLTIPSNLRTDLSLTDIETGARAGCRIYEVGISHDGRTYAEGRVGWRDGLRAIYAILKY